MMTFFSQITAGYGAFLRLEDPISLGLLIPQMWELPGLLLLLSSMKVEELCPIPTKYELLAGLTGDYHPLMPFSTLTGRALTPRQPRRSWKVGV